MNWSVTVRVLRDTALTDAEKDRLLAHVRQIRDGAGPSGWDLEIATGAPVDGVVAGARHDLYYRDPHDSDTQRLCAALGALRGVLEGARTEVCDSYELLGWNAVAGRYETLGTNDVPRFGFEPTDGFVRLGSLSHHHRFGEARVTHTATRVEIPATQQAETPLQIAGSPVFVDDVRRGDERRVLAAWLHNATAHPLFVHRVDATLLDAAGLVVDHDDEGVRLWVRKEARLLVPVPGPKAIQHLARSVSLVAEAALTFEHPLGAYAIDRTSAPPLMKLVAEPSTRPSPFPVSLTLGGFVDVDEPDRNWRLVIELRALQPAVSARVDLLLDLRDAQGRTLANERQTLELSDEPTRVAVSIWHAAHELGDVARIEVSGTFSVTRRLPLGAWSLPA